jgi:hypothetical protein
MNTSSSRRAAQKLAFLPSGSTQFHRVVQSQLDSMRQAPVLLISSETAGTSKAVKQVADACQFVRLTLGQQFGLRIVDTKVSSTFPTLKDVDQRLELMQRTGAASIVAVGSGAAMDLAKAIQNQNDTASKGLLVVPATFGAVLASGANHALLLDTVEETLVPSPQHSQNWEANVVHGGFDLDSISTATIVSCLDARKYMEPLDQCRSTMLYAAAAILLDAGMQPMPHPSLSTLLDSTFELLSSKEENNNNDLAITNLLFQSANLLSYGLPGVAQNSDRSISMALLASLLPTIFPHTHPMTFLASLVPGFCHVLKTSQPSAQPQLQQLVDILEKQQMPLLPKVVVHDQYEGFSIPDMALSCMESNQQVWNCLDATPELLLTVLQHSLGKQGGN